VPPERRFLDYHQLLQSDVDGVIVCPSGSHAAPAIAAAEAGKHVFVEKPMCTTVREAEAMVAAADKAGVLLMVGYMKRHEPAYQFAQARVREMSDVRFIQVNHLHPSNDLHTSEFKVRRFDDIPRGVRDAWNIHRVLSSEIWLDGRGVSTVLDYGDERRAVASWVDLPDLWDFKETLEVYGSRERVLVSFPTGFARGLPSYVISAAHAAVDDMWRAFRAFYARLQESEQIWNDLATAAAG
jgi:hypothetical protein